MFEVLRIDFERMEVELNDGDIRKIESGELMQSIGVFDKEGNEIFEDDIIEWEGMYFNVVYDNEFAMWWANPISKEPKQCESCMIWKKSKVIGNLHENQEIQEKYGISSSQTRLKRGWYDEEKIQ
jgi:hypothetical protein